MWLEYNNNRCGIACNVILLNFKNFGNSLAAAHVLDIKDVRR
jgi:hypothetical protein